MPVIPVSLTESHSHHNQSHATHTTRVSYLDKTHDNHVGLHKSHVRLILKCYNKYIQRNLQPFTIIKGRTHTYDTEHIRQTQGRTEYRTL